MKRLKFQTVILLFFVFLRVQGRVISPFNNDHSQSFTNANQGGYSNPYQIYNKPTIVTHDAIHETDSFSLNKNLLDQNVVKMQPETFHDTYTYPINSWPASVGGNRGKIMVEQTINFAPSIMPISENMANSQNGMFLNPDFNIVASNSIGSGFNKNTFDQNVELGEEMGAKGVKVSNTADIFTNNNSIDQNIKFIQHVIPLESSPLANDENTPDVVALSSKEESTSQNDVQGRIISDSTESDLIVSSISAEEPSSKGKEKSNKNEGFNDDNVKDTLNVVGLNLDENTEVTKNSEENVDHSSETSLVQSSNTSEKNLVESSSSSKTKLVESSSSSEINTVESSTKVNQNTTESPLVSSGEDTFSKSNTSMDNDTNKGSEDEPTKTSGRIGFNLDENLKTSDDIAATTESNSAETDQPTNTSERISVNSDESADSGTTELNSVETDSIETLNDSDADSENVKNQNISDSASKVANSFEGDNDENDGGSSNDSKNTLGRVDGKQNQEDDVQDENVTTETNIVQKNLVEPSNSTENDIFENKNNQKKYDSTLVISENSEMPSKNNSNEEKTQGLINAAKTKIDVSNPDSNVGIQNDTLDGIESSSSQKGQIESSDNSKNILSKSDVSKNIQEETKTDDTNESNNQQLIFSDGKIKLYIEKIKSTSGNPSDNSNGDVNELNKKSVVSVNKMEKTSSSDYLSQNTNTMESNDSSKNNYEQNSSYNAAERLSDGSVEGENSTYKNEPEEKPDNAQIDTPEPSHDEDTSSNGDGNQSNPSIEDTQTNENNNDREEKSMDSEVFDGAANAESESSDDISLSPEKDIASKNDAQKTLVTDVASSTTNKETADDSTPNSEKEGISKNDVQETSVTDDVESSTAEKGSSNDIPPNPEDNNISNNEAQETIVTDDAESLPGKKESSDDIPSNPEENNNSNNDAQKTIVTDDAESLPGEKESSDDIPSNPEENNISNNDAQETLVTDDSESLTTEKDSVDDISQNPEADVISQDNSQKTFATDNADSNEINTSKFIEDSLNDKAEGPNVSDDAESNIISEFDAENETYSENEMTGLKKEANVSNVVILNLEDDILQKKIEDTFKTNNPKLDSSSSFNNIPETSTTNPDTKDVGQIEDLSSKKTLAPQEDNLITPIVSPNSEPKDEEKAKLNDMYLSLSTLSNQDTSRLKVEENVQDNGLKKKEPENTINGININQPFQSVSVEPNPQLTELTLEEDKLKNLIDQQDSGIIQNTESNNVNEETAQPAYIEKPLLKDDLKEDKLKHTMDSNIITMNQHIEDVQDTKTNKVILEQENHLTHVEKPLSSGSLHETIPKPDEEVISKGNIINQNIAEKSVINHGINTDFTKSLNELSESSIESIVNQNIDKENILSIDHDKTVFSGPLHKDKTASNFIGESSKGNKISQNIAKGSFLSHGTKTDLTNSTNKLGDASIENTVYQNIEETHVAGSLVNIAEDNVKTEEHVQVLPTGPAHKNREASNIGGVGSKHNTINQNILQGSSVSYGTHSDTAKSFNKLGDDSLENSVNQNVETDTDNGSTVKSGPAHKDRVASNIVGVGSKGNKINQNIAEGSSLSYGTKTDVKESSNELGKASVENVINQNIDKVESSRPLAPMDSSDVLYDDQVQYLPLAHIHEENNIVEESHISHAINTDAEESSNIVSDSLIKDIPSYDAGKPSLITDFIQENHRPEKHEQESSSGLVYKVKTSSNILGLNTKGNTVNQNIDEGLPSNGGIHTDVSKSTNSIGGGSAGNVVNQNMNIMSSSNNEITENLKPFIQPSYTGSKLKIKESSNLLGFNTEGNLVNQNIDQGLQFHNSGTYLSKSSNIIGEGSADNTVNQNMNKGINIDTKVDLSGLTTHSSYFDHHKYSGTTQKIKKSSNILGLSTKGNIVNQNIDEGTNFNHGILTDLSESSNVIGDSSTGNTVNQNVNNFVNVDSRRTFMGHSIFQSNFMRPLHSSSSRKLKKSSNILGLNTKRNIINQNINEGFYLNRGTYTDISKSMNAIGEGSAANRVNQNINRVISDLPRHPIEKTIDSTPLIKRSYPGPIHKIKKSSNILGLNTKGNTVNQNIVDGSYTNHGIENDISKTMNEIGDGSVGNVVNQNINQHAMDVPINMVKSSSNILGLLKKRNTVNQNIEQLNHEVMVAPTYYPKPSQSGPLHKERVALNSVGLKASGNRINQNIIKGSALHHGIETDISNSINTIDDGSTGNVVNQNIAEIGYIEQ